MQATDGGRLTLHLGGATLQAVELAACVVSRCPPPLPHTHPFPMTNSSPGTAQVQEP
jgi:hypothetical protein